MEISIIACRYKDYSLDKCRVSALLILKRPSKISLSISTGINHQRMRVLFKNYPFKRSS